MLTYQHLKATRARPERRPRSARQIALAARAAQRDQRRHVRRSR